MSNIKLTIAIPTIGDNNFLGLAVQSALESASDKVEVLICDNASGKASEILAMANADPLHRVRVLTYENRVDMAANWNRCLSEARGEFFLLLSDDDLIKPGFCSAMLERMTNPDVGAATCGIEFINENGEVFWTVNSQPEFESPEQALLMIFKRKRVLLPCATVLRTADLKSVGGYDSSFGNWADMKAWISICANYKKIAYSQECLAQYRERAQSLTKVVNDSAWEESVSKTVELSKSLFPSKRSVIEAQGGYYLKYMLADIKLKRLVALEKKFIFCIPALWRASAKLQVTTRLWLMAKLAYCKQVNTSVHKK